MSVQPPTNCDCPIFNPDCGGGEISGLTPADINFLKDHFLEYPIAQGTETLIDTIVSGTLVADQTVQIEGNLTANGTNIMNGTVAFNSVIEDHLGLAGTAGQALTSTGDGYVLWQTTTPNVLGIITLDVNVNYYAGVSITLPTGANIMDVYVLGGGGQSVQPQSSLYDEATAKANNANSEGMSGGGASGAVCYASRVPVNDTETFTAFLYPNLLQWGYSSTSQTAPATYDWYGTLTMVGTNAITIGTTLIGDANLLGYGALLIYANNTVVNTQPTPTIPNGNNGTVPITFMPIFSGTNPNFLGSPSLGSVTNNEAYYGYNATNATVIGLGTVATVSNTTYVTLTATQNVPTVNQIIFFSNGNTTIILEIVSVSGSDYNVRLGLTGDYNGTYITYYAYNGLDCCLQYTDGTLIAKATGGGRGTIGNYDIPTGGNGSGYGGSYQINTLTMPLTAQGGNAGGAGVGWNTVALSGFGPQEVYGGVNTLGGQFAQLAEGGGGYWSYEGWNVQKNAGRGGVVIIAYS